MHGRTVAWLGSKSETHVQFIAVRGSFFMYGPGTPEGTPRHGAHFGGPGPPHHGKDVAFFEVLHADRAGSPAGAFQRGRGPKRGRGGQPPCAARAQQAGRGQKDVRVAQAAGTAGRPHDYHFAVRGRGKRRDGRHLGRKLCRRHHHFGGGVHQRRAGRVSGKQGRKGHRGPAADDGRHQQGAARRQTADAEKRAACARRRGGAGGGPCPPTPACWKAPA